VSPVGTDDSFLKASSVGANTVNVPGAWSADASPALVSAPASVLNEPAATAVATRSSFGGGMT
jgi:hypothetical protein